MNRIVRFAVVGAVVWRTSVGFAAPIKKTPAPTKTDPKAGELLKDDDGNTPKKFETPTKEENQAALEDQKKFGAHIAELMKVEFITLETAHFIIFTDWDAREANFLRTNVEGAYVAVARTLEVPVTGNVFVGKLPIFMFASQKTFQKFAREISKFDAPDNVLGYFLEVHNGYGYMSMWKPDVKKAHGDVKAAEREWAYTLTHEFTHAFVSRYRTDAHFPLWLNEGLAEVVAYRQFPRPWVYPFVRDRAKGKKSLNYLFSNRGMLEGDDYPVAQTVVETLIVVDHRAFLRYLNDIKDGMTADDALAKEYKHDVAEIDGAWRKYIASIK